MKTINNEKVLSEKLYLKQSKLEYGESRMTAGKLKKPKETLTRRPPPPL